MDSTVDVRHEPAVDEAGARAQAHPPSDRPSDPPTDLAGGLLADLRRARGAPLDADGRPLRRSGSAARRRAVRRENLTGRNSGGYSGPAPDPRRDPHRLGELLGGLLDEQGWTVPLTDARVFAEWSALVGADVAAHCAPQSLVDGELRITAESTAWATQLRMLAGILLARLTAELGPDVVRRITVSGPTAPSWKHGGWSVRGARGPRDTYG